MKLYVDDNLLLISRENIEETLNIFNSFHPKIEFTIKETIPFLDMNVIREGNEMRTNWYKKPINMGRYINFHFNLNSSQKKT